MLRNDVCDGEIAKKNFPQTSEALLSAATDILLSGLQARADLSIELGIQVAQCSLLMSFYKISGKQVLCARARSPLHF